MYCYRKILGIKWIDKVAINGSWKQDEERKGLWRAVRRRQDRFGGPWIRGHLGPLTLVMKSTVKSKNCRVQQILEYLQQIVKEVGI